MLKNSYKDSKVIEVLETVQEIKKRSSLQALWKVVKIVIRMKQIDVSPILPSEANKG